MRFRIYLALILLGIVIPYLSQAQPKKTSIKYTSAKEAIYALIDTVSKTGINANEWISKVTMVNNDIKPAIKKWMDIFGEGLVDVKPWTIKGEAIGTTEVNFTTKNDIVYVLIRGAMRDLLIKSLAIHGTMKPIDAIKMLGSNERISWEQQERALNLEKPDVLASEDAVVFKITFQEYYKSKGTQH